MQISINCVFVLREFSIRFFSSSKLQFQTNDVFESRKNIERSTPQPLENYEIDERVAVTSQDVALINSDQALVSTKEKSTKDKVRAIVIQPAGAD